jgi:putative phosphoesterase
MPTSLVLLADTHVPKRAPGLPPELWAAIDDADVVVHAGDWVGLRVLEELERRARVLVGVFGNNDGAALRARLPEVARFEVDGIRLAVIHETGPASGRETRMDAAFPDAEVLVFGHSHIPWDTVSPQGLRLLNPGSPTDRRRQPVATFMTARIEDGAVHDVRLEAVDPGWRAG